MLLAVFGQTMKPVQLAVRLRPVRAEALSDAKAKELVFTTAADGGPGAVVLKDGKDGKDVSSVNVDYLWGKDATTESVRRCRCCCRYRYR